MRRECARPRVQGMSCAALARMCKASRALSRLAYLQRSRFPSPNSQYSLPSSALLPLRALVKRKKVTINGDYQEEISGTVCIALARMCWVSRALSRPAYRKRLRFPGPNSQYSLPSSALLPLRALVKRKKVTIIKRLPRRDFDETSGVRSPACAGCLVRCSICISNKISFPGP